jgi:hypothetical protein
MNSKIPRYAGNSRGIIAKMQKAEELQIPLSLIILVRLNHTEQSQLLILE